MGSATISTIIETRRLQEKLGFHLIVASFGGPLSLYTRSIYINVKITDLESPILGN